MNDSYYGLRVFPKDNPTLYAGPRGDRQGCPVVTGTVRGCNGAGSAYIRWDDGRETLTPLNEVETYGQYDATRIR